MVKVKVHIINIIKIIKIIIIIIIINILIFLIGKVSRWFSHVSLILYLSVISLRTKLQTYV